MIKIFKWTFLIFQMSLSFYVQAQNVFYSDIDNFWKAYDKISQTKDSVQQYQLLEKLYFEKGSEGLAAIRKARNYTAKDYIDAINNYPKFWNSVRQNTLKSKQFTDELNAGIEKLRKVYPDLKPAKIYFTIGALRTNGTIQNDLVLIGSELAMANATTNSEEFPENIKRARRTFFDSDPLKNLVLLNIHEYVHTQQNTATNNLLSYVIHEGVAEFVSVKAMNVKSATPAVAFGKANAVKVREKFEEEMFYGVNLYKWLWGDAKNDFDMRDLGYYIGYQICENYYNQASNKAEAIKKMIELDYTNDAEVNDFISKSAFFPKPVSELESDFEAKRPKVIAIKQFENQSKKVSSNLKEITVEFSEPLNGFNTGVDYGDIGETAFPKNDFTKRYWSDDKKSWTLAVQLEPNKKYQILLTANFRTDKNVPLKPFLIEFETKD